jgi:hypothetical protein
MMMAYISAIGYTKYFISEERHMVHAATVEEYSI